MTVPPERLALLPSRSAVELLTTAVLQEREPLRASTIDKAAIPLPADARWNAEPVRELVDEARKRFEDDHAAADAWLAPRLHATLRLTRREAANGDLWNHVALRVAPDYVFWRHRGRSSKARSTPTVNSVRFVGPFHSQAFARLWWAAELFRDGYDYGPVVTACGNQDVLNTVLRLEVILHRPTAQALIQLLKDGTVRTGRDVNGLAQSVNTAGTTLSFEAIAPDAAPDPAPYEDWLHEIDNVFVPMDALPDGPDDGRAPLPAVRALTALFTELFATAPVRGKKPEI